MSKRSKSQKPSRRELEMLAVIAVGGKAKDAARIFMLSPKTVDVHLTNVRLKLEEHSSSAAAEKAQQSGLISTELLALVTNLLAQNQ